MGEQSGGSSAADWVREERKNRCDYLFLVATSFDLQPNLVTP